MKKTLLFTLMMVIITIQSVSAQKRKDKKEAFNSRYNYEIQAIAVGAGRTKVYKVWGNGKKVDAAMLNAKRSAVAAAIFIDIPGRAGVEGTPAICKDSDAEQKHSDFFDRFFDWGGEWQKYVNLTEDAAPSGPDRLKVKKGYKVGIVVQILYDNLRKDLEKAGVARSLNYGF